MKTPTPLTPADITAAFRSQDDIDRVCDALATVLELLEPNAVVGILALVQTTMMAMLNLRNAHPDAADQVTIILQQLLRAGRSTPTRGVH